MKSILFANCYGVVLSSFALSKCCAFCMNILYIQFIVSKTTVAVVPKLCSADPKRSATSSQGIHRYIPVMATLKFHVVLKIMAEFL